MHFPFSQEKKNTYYSRAINVTLYFPFYISLRLSVANEGVASYFLSYNNSY